MKELISQSKNMSTEYCATVVRVDEVKPIEGSDFLGVTVVEGRDIVVRKDAVHENDIMIYVSNECQLCREFLYKNNEFADSELNANYEWTLKVIAEMKNGGATAEDIDRFIKANRGYFNKNGRVRMMKLRGTISMGYLIKPESMETYKKELQDFKWDEHVGEHFDAVLDELFVKAYVPETKERKPGKGRAEKKIKRFDRMIPGQFAFHYDTQQLQSNMDRFRPNTSVSITTKWHGTSAIYGNVKVKNPRWRGFYTKMFNYLPSFLQFTKDEYDFVYSSRSVIKNSDLNPSVTDGFYSVDVWNDYYQLLRPYIPAGMTIYGEIVGYLTGENRGIQSLGGKVYDYGCKPGENKLMIYRVKDTAEDGTVTEWNISDVYKFTLRLKNLLSELDRREGTHNADRIALIDILHIGTFEQLYPDICSSTEFREAIRPRKATEGEDKYTRDARLTHNKTLKEELDQFKEWKGKDKERTMEIYLSNLAPKGNLLLKAYQNVLLNRLKHDVNFHMEMDEPTCVNQLPREGVVVRINDDPMVEAFKLKTLAFLGKESKDIDSGKTDTEMAEKY